MVGVSREPVPNPGRKDSERVIHCELAWVWEGGRRLGFYEEPLLVSA